MFRYTFSSITIIFAIISIIAVKQASAMECWGCESKKDAFCTVMWDSTKVSEQDKANHYGECPGETCVKMIVSDGDEIKGAVRACMANVNEAKKSCEYTEKLAKANGVPNAKAECFTCDSDGCNGATQYGPIVLLVALPVAIAKNFLF